MSRLSERGEVDLRGLRGPCGLQRPRGLFALELQRLNRRWWGCRLTRGLPRCTRGLRSRGLGGCRCLREVDADALIESGVVLGRLRGGGAFGGDGGGGVACLLGAREGSLPYGAGV